MFSNVTVLNNENYLGILILHRYLVNKLITGKSFYFPHR